MFLLLFFNNIPYYLSKKKGIGFVYGGIFDWDGIALPVLCHFPLAKELMFTFCLTGWCGNGVLKDV